MFPKDFVWGVASSAYQMEGTDPDDGRGKNVWDEFVRSGRVYEQQTADVSCFDAVTWNQKLSFFTQLVKNPSGGNREGE